jgi:hypothetical protein
VKISAQPREKKIKKERREEGKRKNGVDIAGI